MKSFKHILMTAVAVLASACYHDVHEFGSSPSSDGEGNQVGYIAAALGFEYPEDEKEPIDNLNIYVTNNSGYETSQNFKSKEETAEWLKRLPVGEYDILVTANMEPSDGYQLTNGVVSLIDPSSSPQQAWYAMAHATVIGNQIVVAEIKLQRLTASLELTITGVPDGTTIDVIVDHMAQSVNLMERDVNGRYGNPSEEYLAVPIGRTSEKGATRSISLTTGIRNLLPTSRSYDRTYIDLYIITPENKQIICLGDTPRMECGHTYIISLDYLKLKPYMYFDWYRINDWTEMAVISGEVPYPDEK